MKGNGVTLGFEKEIFQAADKLRKNVDAALYKHIVLGLVFLKYVGDKFEKRHSELKRTTEDPQSKLYIREEIARYGVMESRDEYTAEGVFWVPKEARWKELLKNATNPQIGKLIDDAMHAIERENPKLKGILPKDYARAPVDPTTLTELINLFANKLDFGDKDGGNDVFGRIYEYGLREFATQEGKRGGQFYTPPHVVKLLVAMLQPFKGRVYDPCCGSGGMFVQSEKFVEEHGGQTRDIAIYGQESNQTTWRLCMMNLAVHGIEGDIQYNPEGSFLKDALPDMRADFVLANPPFNMKDWGQERLKDDARWKHGLPPQSNANFAWIQHFIHHLKPTGRAGFVMGNSSLSSVEAGEGDTRQQLVEAGYVDCIVSLPSHLFYSTPNQVCLWFIRPPNPQLPTLFIDARDFGTVVERKHRELSADDILRIADTYSSWRVAQVSSTALTDPSEYADVPSYCRSVALTVIRSKRYILTPSRYVGAADASPTQPGIPFDVLCARAVCLIERAAELQRATGANLLRVSPPKPETAEYDVANYDDAVLASRKLAELVQLSRQELFRSWFVSFDPVHARRGTAEVSFPEWVLELFPESFEETELGEVPAGWQVGTFADVLTPSTARIGEAPAPEYSATVSGLEPRGIRFNKLLSKSTKNNMRIVRNDLVFGLSRRSLNFGLMTDPVGSVSPVYEVFHINVSKYIGEALELYIRLNMHQHIDVLRPGEREGQPIDREFLLEKPLLIPDYRIQTTWKEVFSKDIRDSNDIATDRDLVAHVARRKL